MLIFFYDDVNFAASFAVVATNNIIAATYEMLGSDVFAD